MQRNHALVCRRDDGLYAYSETAQRPLPVTHRSLSFHVLVAYSIDLESFGQTHTFDCFLGFGILYIQLYKPTSLTSSIDLGYTHLEIILDI